MFKKLLLVLSKVRNLIRNQHAAVNKVSSRGSRKNTNINVVDFILESIDEISGKAQRIFQYKMHSNIAD